MKGISEDDLNECVEAVGGLYENRVSGSIHERRALEAIANLLSGAGVVWLHSDLQQMLTFALETGYVEALQDVEEGKFDDEITEWRADLFGGAT